jgi:hypothetical protein
MQSSPTLLKVCAALAVILGIVSGILWHDLRSARQQIADLQDQLTQSNISGARSAQVQALPPTIEAPSVPPVAAPLPELRPPLPVAPRAPAPPAPVVSASVRQPLIGATESERRADALMQSERTATARVRAWNTALNLTPEQLQALNAATTAELRRETEESLQIDDISGPMDAQTAARVKVETVTRQHETLVRILEKMKPQLTPEQSNRMGTMFDGWLTANMARARAEQERAAMSGY